METFYSFDTESTGPSTFSDVATEIGFVHEPTGSTFHGVLWDATPHPDIPALPVLTEIQTPARWSIDGGDLIVSPHAPATSEGRADVFVALSQWRNTLGGGPLFSDNPAFDWQWIAYGFGEAGLKNPFGYSCRRIGDLYAGLNRKPKDHNSWKRLRRTKHDHSPVNDAKGNAEALRTVLDRHTTDC